MIARPQSVPYSFIQSVSQYAWLLY